MKKNRSTDLCIFLLFFAIIADAKISTIFNDRAAGVKEQGYVMINGQPCGKRAGDGLLFCMNPVHEMSDASFRDVKALISDFGAEVKRLELGKQPKVQGWDLIFKSNRLTLSPLFHSE